MKTAEGAGVRNGSRSRARRNEPARSGIDYGPLESSIGYRLRRAQLAIFEDVIRIFDEVGLRPGSFSVLAVIGRNPGLKQSEVSAALGIQRTNFVGLIDSLERRGLAVRKPSEKDRRSYALHLTPAGRELVARATELQRRHEAALAKRLGPDGRESLLELLQRLTPPG
jgi:DNA-binding MarR family transcriptional regulator